MSKIVDEMSVDEMRAKLHSIYRQEGTVLMYLANEEMLKVLSQKLDIFRDTLDLTADDGKKQVDMLNILFKNSVDYALKQEALLEIIDEDILKEERAKKLAAETGSVEDFVGKIAENA